MANIPRELQDALEAMIDAHGLANVVDGLAEIAAEKADHIGASYGDSGLAQAWYNASNVLMRAEMQVVKYIDNR